MLHKEKGWGGDGGSILMRHQQRRGADSLDRRLPAPVMMLHALGSKLPWASFPGNCVTVLGPLPLSFPRGLLDAAIPSPPPPLVSEEAYSSPVALSMPPAWLLTQAAGLMSMDACGCRLSLSLMPSYPLWSLLPPPGRSHHLHLLVSLNMALDAARCISSITLVFDSVLPLSVVQLSSVQSLSHIRLFVTPRTAACQASLSITNSWSLLKLMSIELVMPSSHLILGHPLLLLLSIFPSIRVFSNESVLCIRWPKSRSFSFSIQSFQ